MLEILNFWVGFIANIAGLLSLAITLALFIRVKALSPKRELVAVCLIDSTGKKFFTPWTANSGLAAAIFWKPALVRVFQTLGIKEVFSASSNGRPGEQASLILSSFREDEDFQLFSEDKDYRRKVVVIIWKDGVLPQEQPPQAYQPRLTKI